MSPERVAAQASRGEADELLARQAHVRTVVPLAVRLQRALAHHAIDAETDLLVRADRSRVRRERPQLHEVQTERLEAPGEQQAHRVAAVAHRPDVALADEDVERARRVAPAEPVETDAADATPVGLDQERMPLLLRER